MKDLEVCKHALNDGLVSEFVEDAERWLLLGHLFGENLENDGKMQIVGNCRAIKWFGLTIFMISLMDVQEFPIACAYL